MEIKFFLKRASFGLGVFVILLGLSGCNRFGKTSGYKVVDEKSAAAFVKEKLSISGDVTAKILKGGLGGSMIFLADNGQKNYVVRVIKDRPQKYIDMEISALKVAESGGYGPKIYFADAARGTVIMEFLQNKNISPEQYESEDLYVALSNVLKKIHNGSKFDSSTNVFDRIKNNIEKIKPYDKGNLPLAKIEHLVATIDKTVFPHAKFAPCHNDLNPGNLMFFGNEFKVVDYESAAQFDPYFDVATVAIFYCFNPIYENTLLTGYLGRQPSLQEQAHLYLMKQLSWITYAFEVLKLVPKEISKYELLQAPTFFDFMKDWYAGKITLEADENKLKYAKACINQALANSESQEFRSAVDLLRKK